MKAHRKGQSRDKKRKKFARKNMTRTEWAEYKRKNNLPKYQPI